MALTLDQLAIKHGTDKSSNGHSYTQYYDQFFTPLRWKPISLLEIGIWENASLNMWAEYFPDGKIYGIDIDDKSQYDTDRIKTFIGDQSNKDRMQEIANMIGDLDIVVDDGSHRGDHQLASFEAIFPMLKPGALYAIEDLLCAMDERWNSEYNFLDRVRQMVGEVNMNGNIPNSFICANKQEAVKKYSGSYWDLHIESVFIACGVVIIKKM